MARTTIISGANGNGAFHVTTRMIEFAGERTRAKTGSQQSPNQKTRDLETDNQQLRAENQLLRAENHDLRQSLREARAENRGRQTVGGSPARPIDPIEAAVRSLIEERSRALPPAPAQRPRALAQPTMPTTTNQHEQRRNPPQQPTAPVLTPPSSPIAPTRQGSTPIAPTRQESAFAQQDDTSTRFSLLELD